MLEAFGKHFCGTVVIIWTKLLHHPNLSSSLGYPFSQGKWVSLQVGLISKAVFFLYYTWYISLDVFGPGAQSIICYRTMAKLAISEANNKPFLLLKNLRMLLEFAKYPKQDQRQISNTELLKEISHILH